MTNQESISETTVSTERVYTGRVVNLRVDTVVTPSGKDHKREIVEHRGAVAIVPIDADGRVVLIRQFRKAAGRNMLEIPAGTLEHGEDPLRCAHRELEEETGLRADHFRRLCSFYTSPGFSTELLHLFLATDLHPGSQSTEEDEQIETSRESLSRAIDMIAEGGIIDGKTIVGLLMARDTASSGQPLDT